jgi:hypothetical protein
MKNKTIAIIGIGSYILSVLASATDADGNFVSPVFLIVISAIVTTVFTVMATVRLWKGARYVSIILVSSAIILFVLSVIQEVTLPKYGSPIIILLNVTKIIHLLAFFYAIILLWTIPKSMRKIFRVLGMVMSLGSGLFMFIFWFQAMTKWLSFWGSLLAVFIAPGLIIFPIIFWIVERVFPVTYFTIWGLGLLGMLIFGLSSKDLE